MKTAIASVLFAGLSYSAWAGSDASIIKVSPLIGGAVTQRVYSLEHASVSGTIIRLTSCKVNSQETTPCEITIFRDVTKGSVAQAIQQFDAFVANDDGD